MPLVAYDNSDDSDDGSTSDKVSASQPKKLCRVKLDEKAKLCSAGQAAPQEKEAKKKTIQILLPSLDEDVSDDSDDSSNYQSKHKSAVAKPADKCGLFALLPPPTTATQLVPHILTKKSVPLKNSLSLPPPKSAVSNSSFPSSIAKPVSSNASAASSSLESNTDDTDDIGSLGSSSSFFFTESTSDKRSAESKGSFSLTVNASKPIKFENAVATNSYQHPVDQINANVRLNQVNQQQDLTQVVENDVYEEPESSSSVHSYLQDEQFLRLCGRKHHLRQPIDIVDVCADEQLRDVDLTKSISEEVNTVLSHSKKNNKDMPSSQQKRKHQITYLAFKAKERELELKNQWSENKFNKSQTQSKYGF